MESLSTPALSATALVLLLLLFYGGTMIMSMRIARKDENADNYMTAGHKIGFGISAASMTATWIWASSMYASVNSGYLYGATSPMAVPIVVSTVAGSSSGWEIMLAPDVSDSP